MSNFEATVDSNWLTNIFFQICFKADVSKETLNPQLEEENRLYVTEAGEQV